MLGFTRRKEHDTNTNTPNGKMQCPPIQIRGQQIKAQKTTKYLGIIIDDELRFHEHVALAMEKGTKWEIAMRRICRTTKGMPPHLTRRLYITTAVPSFLYAADIFTPHLLIRHQKKGFGQTIRNGPIAKLARIQRQAALTTIGAMRTTATDTIDAHANILPFHLLLKKLCLQATVRHTTLQETHPLAKSIQKAYSTQVKAHRSPLHDLFAINPIDPRKIEKKMTYKDDKNENENENESNNRTEIFTTYIEDKQRAKNIRAPKPHEMQIFTDGSGIDGRIGAAATTMDRKEGRKTLRYRMGKKGHHTVYEAELVGIILATHLAHKRNKIKKLTIYTDNQATIKALKDEGNKPRSYLTTHITKSRTIGRTSETQTFNHFPT